MTDLAPLTDDQIDALLPLIIDMVPNVSVDQDGRPYAWVKFARPLTNAEVDCFDAERVPDHNDELYVAPTANGIHRRPHHPNRTVAQPATLNNAGPPTTDEKDTP